MEKKIIFETSSLYRDQFRVTGFEFGEGEKSVCIVGNTRGNEVQQIYTCSKLVKAFKGLEAEGKIKPGHKILVIPSANPYSVNSQKRFWPTDNTDINRMFPGYNLGETTQRIAAGVFEEVQHYTYGIQFGSFYMPGRFMPHVRMMQTGFEDVEMAKSFGMPYVVLRKVRPYETTTLNYNWQIWETKAFTIYTTTTDELDEESAVAAVEGVLRFMVKQGVLEENVVNDSIVAEPQVIVDVDMLPIRANVAGLYVSKVKVGDHVVKGQLLAEMIDPLDGEVKEELIAPRDGVIFFNHGEPLTYARTAVIKLL
ncbi:MAG: succinylglutamate desuccinylase/aspartoacylase family protein [Eubacterium sp.]|nr:succinylglutamate desuccinylase/aspartoacylase family protein [Eubacterium sp.]